MTTIKKNLAVGYISKAQAIERLKLNFPISQGADNSRDRHRYMQALADLQAIKELPLITPQEPKTGYWISTETKGVRYAFWCRYKCSLCGGLSDRTNFCPYCGAKMDGENDDAAD